MELGTGLEQDFELNIAKTIESSKPVHYSLVLTCTVQIFRGLKGGKQTQLSTSKP